MQITHYVDVSKSTGRCEDCGKVIKPSDDWTIHPTLATC